MDIIGIAVDTIQEDGMYEPIQYHDINIVIDCDNLLSQYCEETETDETQTETERTQHEHETETDRTADNLDDIPLILLHNSSIAGNTFHNWTPNGSSPNVIHPGKNLAQPHILIF
jgi:hypothetical protein